MPPFVPYPKIADSLAAWQADDADRRALDKQVWVASEKVHGANLCIGTDGTAIEIAKRRVVLALGKPFFAYERAIGPLVAAVRRLARALGDAAWVLIYGELFGGHYPHPPVVPVEGVAPVQTGVHYAPNVRFCAFDLAIVDRSGAGAFVPSIALLIELITEGASTGPASQIAHAAASPRVHRPVHKTGPPTLIETATAAG